MTRSQSQKMAEPGDNSTIKLSPSSAEGKASTSFVQRYLQIGYNRAARIIEKMEKELVSPADRVGRREVLLAITAFKSIVTFTGAFAAAPQVCGQNNRQSDGYFDPWSPSKLFEPYPNAP